MEVQEDDTEDGYISAALGHGIVAKGDTLDQLRANVLEAVQFHFCDGVPGPMPRVPRPHFVRDEVLAS